MEITFSQEEGQRSRVETLVNEAHTFTLDVYQDDYPVELDSALTQVRVQNPGGGDVGGQDLVEKTNTGVTIGVGADGFTENRITYTLEAIESTYGGASQRSQRRRTRGDWEYSYILTWYAVRSGETEEHERRVLFDVVVSRLYNVVREEDLFELVPALRTNRAAIFNGVADATGGTTETLVDGQLRQYDDGWFTGGVLELLNGADEGETREVTNFVNTTGTVTFFPAISLRPNGDKYRLRRSWAPLIELAYEDIKWRVRSRGDRAALIIDAGELFRPIAYRAVQLCYESISAMRGEDVEGDAPNWNRAQEYRAKYDRAFESTPFRYDTGDDGAPDSALKFAAVRASRR